MPREHWSESDDPRRFIRGAGLSAGAWITIAVLFCAALSGILWGLGVFTSGVKGTGDVIKKNNDANNRVTSQAYFQALNGDIEAYGVQLVTAGEEMTAHPGDQFYETNYTGLYNTCVSAVKEYNASSGKTLFKDWKAYDLPETISDVEACPRTPFPTTSK
jgi:hypothetical protein